MLHLVHHCALVDSLFQPMSTGSCVQAVVYSNNYSTLVAECLQVCIATTCMDGTLCELCIPVVQTANKTSTAHSAESGHTH